MIKREDFDRVLALAKRWQRRFLFADYADEQLRSRWLETPPDAPYKEKVFPVAPDRTRLGSIVVFKPDEIGDVLCALPALSELKRALPDTRLYLICQDVVASLVERTGLFHQISPLRVKMRLLRFPSFSLGESLARFDAKDFDLALYLRTYPVYFPSFLRLPTRAFLHPLDPRMPSRSRYQVPIQSWREPRLHQTLQMLRLVEPLTGKRYGVKDIVYPRFQWTDADREALSLTFGSTKPPRFGVVLPFAKYEVRRYPLEYWRKILPALGADLDLKWIIVGGREDERIPDLPGAIQMQGKLSLAQTAYLVSRAEAFVGTESGPAHLAAALGIPSVTLKGGQSLAAEWTPPGRSLVLRAAVPCAPCHRRVCPGYGLACLIELTPEKVLPEILSFLRGALAKAAPRSRETVTEIPIA